jgi:hypothetical protein
MRLIYAAIALPCLIGAAAAQPPAPGPEVPLPYSACGTMAALRTNLTATPDPSPRSDALLHRLGVRCVGPRTAQVRARY